MYQFTVHEHKLHKFAYFVLINCRNSFDKIFKRGSVKYKVDEYVSTSLLFSMKCPFYKYKCKADRTAKVNFKAQYFG